MERPRVKLAAFVGGTSESRYLLDCQRSNVIGVFTPLNTETSIVKSAVGVQGSVPSVHKSTGNYGKRFYAEAPGLNRSPSAISYAVWFDLKVWRELWRNAAEHAIKPRSPPNLFLSNDQFRSRFSYLNFYLRLNPAIYRERDRATKAFTNFLRIRIYFLVKNLPFKIVVKKNVKLLSIRVNVFAKRLQKMVFLKKRWYFTCSRKTL